MQKQTMKIPYTKLVGAGNDFVLVDALDKRLASAKSRWAELARAVCDRRQGIGADGLLVQERSRKADVRMRIFNPDGSEPSMCGNGIRCLAWYAHRSGTTKQTMAIETLAGIKRAEIRAATRVRVDMGVPQVLERIPSKSLGFANEGFCDFIDSGVPHLVCWVDDVSKVDVQKRGEGLRYHKRFKTQGTNVDFVQCTGKRAIYDAKRGVKVHHYKLRMRTYERGVEGETQACGTGSVAAAIAQVLYFPFSQGLGRESNEELFQIEVRVPGGLLVIDVSAKFQFDRKQLLLSHAFMEGEARQQSRGEFAWNGRRQEQ